MFSKLKKIFEKNDENIQKYIDTANNLVDSFYRDERIRIPFIGCYNSGKSSIINSFIGDDLLPVDDDVCTNIIIFIRHHNSDEPILFKADIKTEYFNMNRYYLIQNELFTPKKNKDNIISFLKNINKLNKPKNNENKLNVEKSYSFYILMTKIKLFDEMEIP